MNEDREYLFARKLEEVRKIAKKQNNSITEEQVKEAFAELKLQSQQLDMVFDYLRKHKIGIGEPVNPEDYMTPEEVDYLAEYVQSLGLLPAYTAGEKEAMILSAMAGDRAAQSSLVQLCLPQVVEVAKLYIGQGVFLEDLIGEGNIAVVTGVTMLGCLEHAGEAEGMLGKIIMDAMEDTITAALNETQADQKIEQKINRVADKARELAQILQRKVSVEELVQESGLSEQMIREAMRISGYAIEEIEG